MTKLEAIGFELKKNSIKISDDSLNDLVVHARATLGNWVVVQVNLDQVPKFYSVLGEKLSAYNQPRKRTYVKSNHQAFSIYPLHIADIFHTG